MQSPVKNNTADKIIFEKESYSISYLGRDESFCIKIRDFLIFLEKKCKDDTKIESFTFSHYGGERMGLSLINKRPISSIIINKEIKNKILKTVNLFLNNPQFYSENNIPHKLNIMLHGPPGTGKTSLIKAIATEFNLPIYNISPSDINGDLLIKLSKKKKGVIAFEDVDAYDKFRKRSRDSNNKIIFPENHSDDGIASTLNFFDGIGSLEGFICILTTNYLEDIDSAIYRAGRMDLVQEIPQIEIKDIPNEFIHLVNDNETGVTGAVLKQRQMLLSQKESTGAVDKNSNDVDNE